MSTCPAARGREHSLGDDILDEIEAEAREILEHPEEHAAVTVAMARGSLDLIHRMRHEDDGELAAQTA